MRRRGVSIVASAFRRKMTLIAAAALAATAAGATVSAHHSFAAQYDREQRITLKGVVTRVQWVNPHVYFHIDVADAAGTSNWALECGSVNQLIRAGWNKDSLKIGDQVTVEGFLARDGSKLANAQSVVRADGVRIFGASGNYRTDRP